MPSTCSAATTSSSCRYRHRPTLRTRRSSSFPLLRLQIVISRTPPGFEMPTRGMYVTLGAVGAGTPCTQADVLCCMSASAGCVQVTRVVPPPIPPPSSNCAPPATAAWGTASPATSTRTCPKTCAAHNLLPSPLLPLPRPQPRTLHAVHQVFGGSGYACLLNASSNVYPRPHHASSSGTAGLAVAGSAVGSTV